MLVYKCTCVITLVFVCVNVNKWAGNSFGMNRYLHYYKLMDRRMKGFMNMLDS